MAMSVKITGIGSLPYQDFHEALQYSLKHDLPFFPQILSIHGNMIEQVKNMNFQFLEDFLNHLRKLKITRYKIQIAGPNTTSLSMSHYETIIEDFLKESQDLEILLCFDEPTFVNSKIIDSLVKKYQTIDFAIHCCNRIDSNLAKIMNESEVRYISYDAILNKDILKLFPNKEIILGCVSPLDDQFISIDKLEVSMISATCGLAHSPRDPATILQDLKKLRNNL